MKKTDAEQLFEQYADEEFNAMLEGMSEAEQAEFRREAAVLFAEMEAMFEAFDRRKVHEKLTPQIIGETPDNELVLAVFDTLALQAPADAGEAAYLAQLSPERRAVYALYIMAGEVDNGGFNQYYYNTEAEAAVYLPEACELIGAPQYAELVRRANECYEKENIAARHDGSLEHFCASYDNNPLHAFDEAFFALENETPLDELLVAFIRSRPEAFSG